MSWSTIIWTVSATICMTFFVIYFIVWANYREAWHNFFFAVMALAASIMSIVELSLIHADTPLEYGELLRWMHVSAATIGIGLVWFLYSYFRAGRRWLAWSYTVLRLLALIPNFLNYPNATFAEITSLQTQVFLGEIFSIPVGEENPWRILIQICNLLLFLFVVDATFQAWKQTQRQHGLIVGGVSILALLLSVLFSQLMTKGVIPGAFISLNFLLIILVMAYELSMDLIRSKELARELYQSQQRMSLAASAANLGLWEWDVIHDNIWFTETGRKIPAISESRHMGFDRYLELVHPDDHELIRLTVDRAFKSGEDFQAEYRTMSPDGELFWIAAHGRVGYDSRHKVTHLRGISMDITERKQSELELNNHRNELAHIARVTTLGQLSTALAHEINQPLGAILRNTETAALLLKQTPLDLEELEAIMTAIRNDNQRAISVIERMRLLLKRREIQFDKIAIDEVVSELEKLLKTEIQARSASLCIVMEDELPKVYADRVYLQQVFLNLLLNSLDALSDNSEEKRQIVIRATQTDNNMVEVAVVDRGTGIASEQLPRLFEPFNSTKKNGMGIGLAISKTIVETLGGSIMASNNPDGGCTVRFTLRIAFPEKETA